MRENGSGVPYLEINATTGALKVLALIDAEEIPELSLEFTVIATEAVDPFMSIFETVSLRIIVSSTVIAFGDMHNASIT